MKQNRRSNGRYSYKGIDLLNWRIWVIVLTIISILILAHYGDTAEERLYVREEDMFMKPVVVTPEPTVDDKIKEYFPRNWKTMIAIAHAESGMNMEAIGYNCYYNGVSKACKKEDRPKAWSVDCFVLQRNYPGRKTCPEGVTLDMHLRESAELSRVQGLSAWVTYNNNLHIKHLANK